MTLADMPIQFGSSGESTDPSKQSRSGCFRRVSLDTFIVFVLQFQRCPLLPLGPPLSTSGHHVCGFVHFLRIVPVRNAGFVRHDHGRPFYSAVRLWSCCLGEGGAVFVGAAAAYSSQSRLFHPVRSLVLQGCRW